jgi:hypothetical protein
MWISGMIKDDSNKRARELILNDAGVWSDIISFLICYEKPRIPSYKNILKSLEFDVLSSNVGVPARDPIRTSSF